MPPDDPDREFGPFRLSFHPKRLAQDGAEVSLTPKALDTLAVLVSRPGELIEKQDLMKAVWGDVFVDESTLTQNIFTIRKVLGEGRYIETVPRRGYRFVAPVREVRGTPERHSMIVAWHGRQPEKSRMPAGGWRVLLGLLAIGLIGALVWSLWARTTPPSTGVHSLAVLPFVNLGQEKDDYISDGLTEEIINAVAVVPGLKVVARTSAFQFKGKNLDVRSIGASLGADTIMEGSVRTD